MGDNLPTVDLGTFCGTDERVTSENACASCAGGATNPAGDNPREYETTCACGVDEYVEQNHCTACPSGLGREGGDPVPGWGTICVESPTCRADERVSSRACVACPAGQTNDAGDATWGGDTACESPPAGADSTNATSETPAERKIETSFSTPPYLMVGGRGACVCEPARTRGNKSTKRAAAERGRGRTDEAR